MPTWFRLIFCEQQEQKMAGGSKASFMTPHAEQAASFLGLGYRISVFVLLAKACAEMNAASRSLFRWVFISS